MKAVICNAPGDLELVERDEPVAEPGSVLVRIRRVGICGTDMHIFQGKHPYLAYPRIMGHELSGEIASRPGDPRLREGQRVYINPYIACQSCHACRRGRPNCCMKVEVLGVHRDGGMVELLAVPERNVFSAEEIDIDAAAMVEFLAIGAHAVARSQMQQGERVLVVGAGPIGLGVMLFAQLAGAQVTALDLRAERLEFARDTMGIENAVLAGAGAEAALAALTDGDFFDVVFDATGNAGSIENSFAYVAHTGSYVLVSVVNERVSFADPEFHKREMRLIGSRNALADDFERVLGAMRVGQVPTKALATHHFPLAELPRMMPALIAPTSGVVKALVAL